MSELRLIVDGLGFAESPRWHDGWVWFVDFFKGAVFRARQGQPLDKVADVPGVPGGLGFLPDGTPLVVSQREFRIYAIRGGALDLHADLSAHAVGAANEMFVDADGTAWVGHHGFDFFGGAEPRPSSLLRVGADGTVSVAADGLIFPNGTARLPDGRLVVAESFASRLTAFTVAPDGKLTGRATFADTAPHTPDGIAVDTEGAVWLGSPMTGTFVRVAEGGEVLDTVKLPDGQWGVACAFVGDGLGQLALVHAETTLEGMPKGESKAFISLVDAAVPGLPA